MTTFRAAREFDYEAIAHAIRTWWDLPGLDSEAAARERAALVPRLWLEHFATTSLIAEHEGELVGFLIAFFSADDAAEGYIHFVGVAPKVRKQGIARTLYERFFTSCLAAGRTRVGCVTSPTNTASIAFHGSMGFVSKGVQADYDGLGVDRVAFIRTLK